MALKVLGENPRLSPDQRDLVELQISQNEASIALWQGNQSLRKHDFPGAIKSLREANRYYKDFRITLSLAGLRVAPGLAARLLNWREGNRP